LVQVKGWQRSFQPSMEFSIAVMRSLTLVNLRGGEQGGGPVPDLFVDGFLRQARPQRQDRRGPSSCGSVGNLNLSRRQGFSPHLR
jgi:hypothetical protein